MKEKSVQELKGMMDSKDPFQLIDVREPYEKDFADIGGELIPMGEIIVSEDRIEKDKPVILYCRSGNRSAQIINYLETKYGLTNLYNLQGGILAWSEFIDPGISKY